MSRADWVELGGQRYSEDELREHQVTEYRCDVCGEFVAQVAVVIVQGAQIIQQFAPFVYVPNLHFHAEHVPKPFAQYLNEGR